MALMVVEVYGLCFNFFFNLAFSVLRPLSAIHHQCGGLEVILNLDQSNLELPTC